MEEVVITKKDVVDEWFKKVWQGRDAKAIREMYAPVDDETATGMGQNRDVEGFVALQQAILSKVTNIKVEMHDDYLEKDDWIVGQCTMSADAIDPSIKSKVVMKGAIFAKIVNGKIRHADNYFDFISYFEGIGLMPENTFMHCLDGNRLVKG